MDEIMDQPGNITCAQCRDALPWYVAGSLPASQRGAIDRHLETCAACQSELAQWRSVAAALRHADNRLADSHLIDSLADSSLPPDDDFDAAWDRVRAALPAPAAPAPSDMASSHRTGAISMHLDDRPSDHPSARRATLSRPRPRSAPAGRIPASPSPIVRGALAVVATVLLLALGSALFAVLGSHRGQSPATSTTTTTSCSASAIRAQIPPRSEILDMAMVSAQEGWMVGATDGPNGMILHYSQCRWQPLSQTFPGYVLRSVVMASATEGWIDGESSDGTQAMLLRYTGGQWQRMPTPENPAASTAEGQLIMSRGEGWMALSSLAKNDRGVWTYALYHYHQGAWTQVAAPALGVFGATFTPSGASAAISFGPDDAWTILSASSGGIENFPAHYSAGHWTTWPLPARESIGQLFMVSPTDGWATGTYQGPTNTLSDAAPFLLHFDGTSWKRAALPNDPDLKAVMLATPTDGWAFAMQLPPEAEMLTGWLTTAAYHYSGAAWQRVNWTHEDIAGIYGLTRVSDEDYWAIGVPSTTTIHGSGGTGQLVLLHYANGVWSEYGTS